jgi:hypothetical protein
MMVVSQLRESTFSSDTLLHSYEAILTFAAIRRLDAHPRLRARDSAALRRQEKRDIVMADRRAADEERLAGRRKQDSDTMDM